MTHTELKMKVPNMDIESNGPDVDSWTWTVHFEQIMDDPNAEPNTWTLIIPIFTTADVQCMGDQFQAAAGAGSDADPFRILLEKGRLA